MKKIENLILGCLIIAVVILYVLVLRNGNNNNQYDEKMRVSSGSIEYMNDGEWKKLTSVGEVIENNGVTKVKDGREIEISIDEGYISWNYVGETNKNKLIAITDLIGEQGNDGIDGQDGKKGINGKNGSNGQDGTNGVDGKNTYIWIKYASANPENENVSLLDTPNKYMGIYYGSKDTAPNSQSEYIWHCIKGENGSQEIVGEKGDKGDKGETGEKGDKGDKGEDAVPVIKNYLYLKGNRALFENEDDNPRYHGTLKAHEIYYSGKNDLITEDGSYIKLDRNKKYLVMLNCGTAFINNADKKEFNINLNVLKDGKPELKLIEFINVDNDSLQGRNMYQVSESKVITGCDRLSFYFSCYNAYSFDYTATIFELAD